MEWMLPDIFHGDINHTVFLEKVSKIREKENYRLISALGAGRIYSSYCEKIWETGVHRDVKGLLDIRGCHNNELLWAPQYQKVIVKNSEIK